ILYICKSYIIKSDLPFQVLYLHPAVIRNSRLCIEYSEYPAGGYHSHLQGVELISYLSEWSEQHLGQLYEGDDHPQSNSLTSRHNSESAVPNDQTNGNGGRHFSNGKEDGVIPHGLYPSLSVLVVRSEEHTSELQSREN